MSEAATERSKDIAYAVVALLNHGADEAAVKAAVATIPDAEFIPAPKQSQAVH